MINIRKSNERGRANHGWLDTHFTFSFADYYDPKHEQFRTLRVMNDDRVAGGGGFPMHPHRDMEIVTYVLEGELQHRDSMGHGEVLRTGEFQHMTAGTGIQHSEFNPSPRTPVHLYQIWLLPREKGLTPSYEQKAFDPAARRNRFQLVAAPDGRAGSLAIHQDAELYLADFSAGSSVTQVLESGRAAWLQVLRGRVSVNGTLLETSDGLAVSEEGGLTVVGAAPAEVMLFDLG